VSPGKLDVASAIISVGVGLTVRSGYLHRFAVGTPGSLPELLYGLPSVRAFVLDRGKHVGCPAQIVYIGIPFEFAKQAFYSVHFGLSRNRSELRSVGSEKLVMVKFHCRNSWLWFVHHDLSVPVFVRTPVVRGWRPRRGRCRQCRGVTYPGRSI